MITASEDRFNTTLKNLDDSSNIKIYEELHNGKLVPVYEPSVVCSKIKPRRYSKVIHQYLSLKELIIHLENGFQVSKLEKLTNQITEEELLLSATHCIVVLTSKDGSTKKEFLVPNDNVATFRQISFKYVKIYDRYFYKCITDAQVMVLLKFKYTKTNDNTLIQFTVFRIDLFNKTVLDHHESISIGNCSDLSCDILLKHNQLYLVWVQQKFVSVLNFATSELSFLSFDIEEILIKDYRIQILSDFLVLTIKDQEFEDSVFSVKDVSKRLSCYYSLKTNCRFDSKEALSNITDICYLEHPSDVIYLNSSEKAVWLVLEWLLPEMTLNKLIFFEMSDRYVSKIVHEINLSELFSEYKTFFGTPNEFQYNMEICSATLQLFIWTSKRHIIIVNLSTFNIDGILELQTEKKYSDFKNELSNFNMKILPDGNEIEIYIKKGKDIRHYEKFVLQKNAVN